jgi:hypothetical protein
MRNAIFGLEMDWDLAAFHHIPDKPFLARYEGIEGRNVRGSLVITNSRVVGHVIGNKEAKLFIRYEHQV